MSCPGCTPICKSSPVHPLIFLTHNSVIQLAEVLPVKIKSDKSIGLVEPPVFQFNNNKPSVLTVPPVT